MKVTFPRRAQALAVSKRRLRLETLEERRLLSIVNWTGSGDGANWGDPQNWSSQELPAVNDDVVINDPGNPTIIYSSAAGDTTIHSLISSDPIRLQGGTLDIQTTATIDAPLRIEGGTLREATVTANRCWASHVQPNGGGSRFRAMSLGWCVE